MCSSSLKAPCKAGRELRDAKQPYTGSLSWENIADHFGSRSLNPMKSSKYRSCQMRFIWWGLSIGNEHFILMKFQCEKCWGGTGDLTIYNLTIFFLVYAAKIYKIKRYSKWQEPRRLSKMQFNYKCDNRRRIDYVRLLRKAPRVRN